MYILLSSFSLWFVFQLCLVILWGVRSYKICVFLFYFLEQSEFTMVTASIISKFLFTAILTFNSLSLFRVEIRLCFRLLWARMEFFLSSLQGHLGSPNGPGIQFWFSAWSRSNVRILGLSFGAHIVIIPLGMSQPQLLLTSWL